MRATHSSESTFLPAVPSHSSPTRSPVSFLSDETSGPLSAAGEKFLATANLRARIEALDRLAVSTSSESMGRRAPVKNDTEEALRRLRHLPGDSINDIRRKFAMQRSLSWSSFLDKYLGDLESIDQSFFKPHPPKRDSERHDRLRSTQTPLGMFDGMMTLASRPTSRMSSTSPSGFDRKTSEPQSPRSLAAPESPAPQTRTRLASLPSSTRCGDNSNNLFCNHT
jgi:hypothetical protein